MLMTKKKTMQFIKFVRLSPTVYLYNYTKHCSTLQNVLLLEQNLNIGMRMNKLFKIILGPFFIHTGFLKTGFQTWFLENGFQEKKLDRNVWIHHFFKNGFYFSFDNDNYTPYMCRECSQLPPFYFARVCTSFHYISNISQRLMMHQLVYAAYGSRSYHTSSLLIIATSQASTCAKGQQPNTHVAVG